MSMYQPALDSYQHGLDQSLAGAFKLASQPTPAQTFMDSLMQREQMDWQRGLQQQAQDRAWQETQRKAAHEDFLFGKYKAEEARKQTESDAKLKDWTAKREQRGQRIKDLKTVADANLELRNLQLEEAQNNHYMNAMIQLGRTEEAAKYHQRLTDNQAQIIEARTKKNSGSLAWDGQDPEVPEAMAKRLLAGTEPWPDSRAQRLPEWQAAMQIVRKLEPDFHAGTYKMRADMQKEASVGQMGRTAVGGTTLIKHLDSLLQATKKLPDTGFKLGNQIINFINEHGPEGSPELASVDMATQAVADEAERYYTMIGGTEAGRKSWHDKLNRNNPLPARLAAIQELATLIQGKLSSDQTRYDTSMGSWGTKQLIDPATQGLLGSIKGGGGSKPDKQSRYNALRAGGKSPEEAKAQLAQEGY